MEQKQDLRRPGFFSVEPWSWMAYSSSFSTLEGIIKPLGSPKKTCFNLGICQPRLELLQSKAQLWLNSKHQSPFCRGNFLSKTKDTSRSWGVLLWNSRRVILGDDIFGERKSVVSGVNVVCPSGTRRRRRSQRKRTRIIGFSIPIRHCWRIKPCLLLRRFFPQRWWWWDSGLKRQCFRAWHDDLWESRVILSDLTGYFLGDIMGYFCGFDWTWGIPPKKGKLHGETHDEPVIEGTIVSVKSGSSVTGIYSLKML